MYNLNKLRLTAATAITGLLMAAQPATAHNLWLLPSATVLSQAETITVDAAVSNDLFYFNHVPLRLDSLQITGPEGQSLQAENPHTGKLRSTFDLSIKQPGSYQLAILNHGLLASYKLNGENKRWRGKPETLAQSLPKEATDVQLTETLGRVETWVTLGKPSLPQPSGQGLELKPTTHPNDLVTGESARFALLVDGQPAPGIKITVIPGGTRWRDQQEEIHRTSDAQGEFTLDWPRAGLYWLEATTSDKKTSFKDAQQRRLSYVLTLEVMPQ